MQRASYDIVLIVWFRHSSFFCSLVLFCKLFALLCFIFLRTALIPYVQVAILNLPHP